MKQVFNAQEWQTLVAIKTKVKNGLIVPQQEKQFFLDMAAKSKEPMPGWMIENASKQGYITEHVRIEMT